MTEGRCLEQLVVSFLLFTLLLQETSTLSNYFAESGLEASWSRSKEGACFIFRELVWLVIEDCVKYEECRGFCVLYSSPSVPCNVLYY